MHMRTLVILLAASVLAACGDVDVKTGSGSADVAIGNGGWTVQILGEDNDQTFLVSGPEGKQAAARVTNGTSALIGASEAQSLIGAAAPADDTTMENKVSIQAPGFSLKVDADDTENAGRGRVSIKAGGVDVDVDGQGDDASGRGRVRIAGLDADAARKFIDDNDDLSAETKAQMREKLGL